MSLDDVRKQISALSSEEVKAELEKIKLRKQEARARAKERSPEVIARAKEKAQAKKEERQAQIDTLICKAVDEGLDLTGAFGVVRINQALARRPAGRSATLTLQPGRRNR